MRLIWWKDQKKRNWCMVWGNQMTRSELEWYYFAWWVIWEHPGILLLLLDSPNQDKALRQSLLNWKHLAQGLMFGQVLAEMKCMLGGGVKLTLLWVLVLSVPIHLQVDRLPVMLVSPKEPHPAAELCWCATGLPCSWCD